jgi:hypothetical protein
VADAKVPDPVRQRRGRNSRQRGNAWERELAHRLAGKRIGWLGGKNDVVAGTGDWLVIQAKVGTAFSEKYWSWLNALDARGDQLRALIIGDAPGAGSKRRAMVVLDLRDFEAWFGEVEADK